MLKKVLARVSRHNRIRAKVSGTSQKPRLAVFKSNVEIYAQLIDDVAGKTLCSASSLKIKKGNKSEKSSEVGTQIAKKALELGVKEVVFDRGGFAYIGRVKALAESARNNGLKF